MNYVSLVLRTSLLIVAFLSIFLSLLNSSKLIDALAESLVIVAALLASSLADTSVRVSRGVRIHLAGFLIPAIFSAELLFRYFMVVSAIMYDLLIGLLVMVFINYFNSLKIRGRGIILLDIIIPLIAIASIVSIIVIRNSLSHVVAIPLSIMLGAWSSIIGLDILNFERFRGKIIVLGGGGLLDAVFLETFLSPGLSSALLIISTLSV